MPHRVHLLFLFLAVLSPLVAVPAAGDEPAAAAPALPDHPRVLATAETFNAMRERRESDPVLDALLDGIEARARGFLLAAPLERVVTGRRMLAVSRDALDRISTLAMAFQTTGDARFAERAAADMLAAAAFEDWNPYHALDVAEMAAALGLGYDWLYDELDADARTAIRNALRDKALALDPATTNVFDWRLVHHNWNAVCFGGLTIAALAIGDEEPGLLADLLSSIREHNPRALDAYGPDGVYPEGPGYWSYGTTFETLMLAALRSATGDDLGLTATPGFLESGAFMAHARGPGGRFFNFFDSTDRVTFTPALLWIAREAGHPEWLVSWRANGWAELAADDSRFAAFTAIEWLKGKPDAAAGTPALSWSGGGENPVAFFRERWDDPDAMYLALKGGRAELNHGQLDAGSFVFEADGVRWAIDLGAARYHALEQQGIDLWNPRQDSDRWRVHPYRNENHNTLTLGHANHRVDGSAAMTGFEPLVDAGTGSATVDLGPPLGPGVSSATRRFTFTPAAPGVDRSVTVRDELDLAAPVAVRWTLMTGAAVEVSADGVTATLREDGRTLRLEMASERPGAWGVEDDAVAEGDFGHPTPGVRRLQWTAAPGPAGPLALEAKLIPGG